MYSLLIIFGENYILRAKVKIQYTWNQLQKRVVTPRYQENWLRANSVESFDGNQSIGGWNAGAGFIFGRYRHLFDLIVIGVVHYERGWLRGHWGLRVSRRVYTVNGGGGGVRVHRNSHSYRVTADNR